MGLGFNDVVQHKSRGNKYVDGQVLTYFIDAFEAVWEAGVADALRGLKAKHPDYELWNFGHSLGASLASISAFAAVKMGIFKSEEVKCVTMGQFRTGLIEYAIAHDQHVPHTYRIVHATDILVRYPFENPLNTEGFYHHRFEVWYNNAMAIGDPFVINERGDDFSGANTVNSTDPMTDNSHLTYFNVNIEDYFFKHC